MNSTKNKRRESQKSNFAFNNARTPAGPGNILGRAPGRAQHARRAAEPALQRSGLHVRAEAKENVYKGIPSRFLIADETQAEAIGEEEGHKTTSKKADANTTRKEKKIEYLQQHKRWKKTHAQFGPRYKNQGLNFMSWNCDSMRYRHRITAQYLDSKNIRIASMQETREADFVYKNQGKYVYISTAAKEAQNGALSGGVGVWIHHSCKIVNYEEVHRNIIKVEVNVQGEHMLVISAYAPQDRKADTERFWSAFKYTLEGCRAKKILVGIDANGKVGTDAHRDFNEVGPGIIHDKTTQNGHKLLKGIEGLGYKIQNTFFKSKASHPNHTYEKENVGGVPVKTQIDFVITKGFGFDKSGWAVQNCQTAPLLTMNKLNRTHIPILTRLQRIHVHRVKNDRKSNEYDKKTIALAINESAEDQRDAVQVWGKRGRDAEDDYNEEEAEVITEEEKKEKERIKVLEEEFQKELIRILKQAPEDREKSTGFSSVKPNRKTPEERAKRKIRLKTFKAETKKIHSEKPDHTWEEQAEKIAELAQVCFPKIKIRQPTWHGVAISEATAKIHEQQCHLEEKLVNTIKYSPHSPTVYLKIQGLKDKIKATRALYEKSADEDVQAFYLERARELERGNTQERDSKAWSLVQTILKKQKTVKKRKTTHIVNNANEKCWTSEKKAEAFGEFIKDNFTEENQNADTNDWWDSVTEKTYAQVQEEPDKNNISRMTRDVLEKGITCQMICHAIKDMARNKADGPDAMAVEIFQTDPQYWAKRLLNIFTNPPELHQLEDGRVAYIFKNKGNTYERTFYRPIAVLNAAYKIWAAAQTMLMAHVIDDIMSITQAGFRLAHGTRDALCRNQNIINRVQEKLLSIGYLDMSKAFDKAIRKKIWERLIKVGCPKSFVAQLRDGHINSHLRPSFEGTTGAKILVTKGVYQGSPLSPVLFIIYSQAFNLLFEEECINRGLHPIEVSTTKRWPASQKPWEKVYDAELEWLSKKDKTIRFTAYADDTVLPTKSLKDLKIAITAFEEACAQYGMEINKDKTEVQTREHLNEQERTELNQGFLKAKPEVDRVSDNVRILGAYSNINGFTKPAVDYRMNIARKTWQ